MALTQTQKELLEGGLLLGGIGLLFWYFMRGQGSGGTVQTLPPVLSSFGGPDAPASITINYPAGANDNLGAPTLPEPFGPSSPTLTIGGTEVSTGGIGPSTTTIGGFMFNTSGAGCGCCTTPAPDTFATPQQAVDQISAINPYPFQLTDVSGLTIPGDSYITSSGQVVSFGASPDFGQPAYADIRPSDAFGL